MARKKSGLEALAGVLDNQDGTPVENTEDDVMDMPDDDVYTDDDDVDADVPEEALRVSYNDTAVADDTDDDATLAGQAFLSDFQSTVDDVKANGPSATALNYMSESRVLQDATKMALDAYEFLPPEWLRDGIVDTCNRMKLFVDMRSASSRYKFSKTQDLEPWQVAEIMLKKYRCVKIDYSKSQQSMNRKSRRANNANLQVCSVAIYDEQDGIYYTDPDYIATIICELYPEANDQYITKAVRHILRNAPRVRLTGHSAGEEWLIPVNNGIYNFKTKELLEFNPKYVFTWKLDVDYNPNALDTPILMPNGKEFTIEWMIKDMMADNEDDVRCLKQSLVALMMPFMPWNKAIFFYSETGASGKGTLAEFLEDVFGAAAINRSLEQLEKQFGIGDLITSGAVCIICHENNVGAFQDKSANFKALTTHDSLSIEAKYKDPIQAAFYLTICQCINEMPRVKDKSDSYWRRYFPIPFPRCYREGMDGNVAEIKDDYLHRTEVKEYFVKMLLEQEVFNSLVPSENVSKLLGDMKEINDPVPRFIDECLLSIDSQGNLNAYPNVSKMPFEWVYEVYKGWHHANIPNGAPVGSETFKSSLLKALGDNSKWRYSDAVLAVSNRLNKDFESNRWECIDKYNVTSLMNVRYPQDTRDKGYLCPMLRKAVRGFLINVDREKEDKKEGA